MAAVLHRPYCRGLGVVDSTFDFAAILYKGIPMQHNTVKNGQTIPEQKTALKLKQLWLETDAWKRLMSFIIDENIQLKNRIAEVLKDGIDAHLLEDVEKFHNRSLEGDLFIGLLRNDVAELDKLLAKNGLKDETSIREAEANIIKLRNNIAIAEKQFSKLKLEFYSYFSENIR
jgi:hypothetical protein